MRKKRLRKYNIDFKNNKIILYVGLDKPTKNICTLIRAFYELKKKIKNVKLIKVGGYEWKSERIKILKLIRELKLIEDIIFTGYVNDEDLPLFYNVADVFIFPSLYEGFGLPILEAMSCGCPVIASNVASISEVVGDAGILIDPLDVNGFTNAMYDILTNNDLRTKLSKRGLKQAKKFSLDDECKKTIKIYQFQDANKKH